MCILPRYRGTYIQGVCTFGALQPTANFSKNWRGTYFRRGTYLRGFTVILLPWQHWNSPRPSFSDWTHEQTRASKKKKKEKTRKEESEPSGTTHQMKILTWHYTSVSCLARSKMLNLRSWYRYSELALPRTDDLRTRRLKNPLVIRKCQARFLANKNASYFSNACTCWCWTLNC